MVSMEEAPSSGLLSKAVAAVVLLVAALLLFKLVFGFVQALFWTALTIAAILAIVWAVATLRT